MKATATKLSQYAVELIAEDIYQHCLALVSFKAPFRISQSLFPGTYRPIHFG
jgi:hypothetical protein